MGYICSTQCPRSASSHSRLISFHPPNSLLNSPPSFPPSLSPSFLPPSFSLPFLLSPLPSSLSPSFPPFPLSFLFFFLSLAVFLYVVQVGLKSAILLPHLLLNLSTAPSAAACIVLLHNGGEKPFQSQSPYSLC